jgi:hypothetical protein
MVLRNGKAIEIPKDSLFAMQSVKLQNGRPDLPALLRDEVELATGRMSVSGQSLSPHLQIKIIPILLLVGDSQTAVQSVCGTMLRSVPGV